MSKLRNLLIANRGEIACRIIRTSKALGIKTTAVYSEADRNALHVEMADDAYALGPAPARESYLDINRVLKAASEVGADSIHPGYGFLSENSEFAQAVIDSGLCWIGPSPESIKIMGNKEKARSVAKEAGVALLPGSNRISGEDKNRLADIGRQVGLPILVKAAAGGGGIGMGRVHDLDDLGKVVQATESMAQNAFGDPGVYLEHFIPSARHVEVQIFGFGDGDGIHLFDRDCSMQRRFQKIVEEAPAPGIPARVRNRLYRDALALMRHQKYEGAGTVEFIYDVESEQAFFLEMNTRIQVEHPVTELVTGIDLVAWQLLQAMDERPGLSQNDVSVKGHAIECRLYAERPEKNFLPAPGIISNLTWPSNVTGLRIESGVRTGDRITPFYDPLIAKLVTHGEDREQAMNQMRYALENLTLEGLRTNAKFLRSAIDHAEFRAGQVTTSFTEKFLSKLR